MHQRGLNIQPSRWQGCEAGKGCRRYSRIEFARQAALEAGAEGAYLANHWAEGGQGAVELAEAVVAACEKPNDFKLLYPD